MLAWSMNVTSGMYVATSCNKYDNAVCNFQAEMHAFESCSDMQLRWAQLGNIVFCTQAQCVHMQLRCCLALHVSLIVHILELRSLHA